MENKKNGALRWLAIVGLGLLAVYLINRNVVEDKAVAISEFISLVQTGEITKVVISGMQVRGETKASKVVYQSTTDGSKAELIKVLLEKKVEFREEAPSQWGSLIIYLLPVLLIVGVIWFMSRGVAGQQNMANKFGQARVQDQNQSELNVKVRFKDVAGADEAVEKVREVVAFLKKPTEFSRLGARIPKGVLLLGPPGTGKTLLARAVAGEAGVPFFAMSGSEFVEMFVGVGASRVRDLFDRARKHTPCIIFIDEVEAIGAKRVGVSTGGGDEHRQTLNQLLKEMDGFSVNNGIIVIGATNKPESLDPAFKRPGRFDRRVVMGLPDIRGREAIFKIHGHDKPLAPDIDMAKLASATPGFSGADIENLLNEAALHAARKGKPHIEMADIEWARDEVTQGPARKGLVMSAQEKWLTAVHEAGHAVVAYFTPEHHPVHRVTVIPRDNSLGTTQFLPKEDPFCVPKSQLLAMLKSALGGRLAEEAFFGAGEVTTGAASDLVHATNLAKRMVFDFAMGDGLGLRSYGEKEQDFIDQTLRRDYSDDTARRLDESVAAIIDKCRNGAKEIINEKRELIDALAKELIKRETLESADVEQILGPRPTR